MRRLMNTAIVTGGAKRIGAELVRALAADGWHVLIHYNRSEAEARALLEGAGLRDVSTRPMFAWLVDRAR